MAALHYNIVVAGLPEDVRFPKLLGKFKKYFKSINIKMFWMRDIMDVGGSKQVTIELASMADARKARNYLNNLPFEHAMQQFIMEVHMADDIGYMEDGYSESRRRPSKRSRARSRTPPRQGYSQEASKLDMEIELLRKQRQVIEEERRLLLEQKKLEMIREYGPSASREFDAYDDFEPPRKRRLPEPVHIPKRTRHKSPPITKAPNRSKGLPVFFQPCKKLIAQMKPFIDKDTAPEEVGILIKLIRAAIRKDLAIALEDKAYIPTPEIVKLYRERHPKEEDEAFVGKILANIRASYLTADVKVEKDAKLKEVKKEKVTENKTSDGEGNEKGTGVTEGNKNVAESNGKDEPDPKASENDKNDAIDKANGAGGKGNDGEGDKVANDEKAPTDTPANGDNETDGDAVPSNVVVKSEPNTSQELENISAGNQSEEVKTKTNDDTLDEAATEEALLGDTEKADDWVEGWNTEDDAEKVQ